MDRRNFNKNKFNQNISSIGNKSNKNVSNNVNNLIKILNLIKLLLIKKLSIKFIITQQYQVYHHQLVSF